MKYYVIHKDYTKDLKGFKDFTSKELAQEYIDKIPKDLKKDQKSNYIIKEIE